MRTLLLVFILFTILLMNTTKCPGCQKLFGQGLSIKTHQRTCAGLHLVGQKQINKRTDNAQKRDAAKLPRLEGRTSDEIAEERQELRDELNDENHPCLVDIPPQEGEAAESSTTVRNNALKIYWLNVLFSLQLRPGLVGQQEPFAFPNDTVTNYHLLLLFPFLNLNPKNHPGINQSL